jgi:hypothetical protein
MNETPKPIYFVGLDLGPVQDPTALAVLERTLVPDAAGRKVPHYAVRHLQRFVPGTPYPAVCAAVARLFAEPPFRGSLLAVDQTGVGRPVVELLRQTKVRARLQPITLMFGQQAAVATRGERLVAKLDVVSALQVLLQTRRLQVSSSLPEAQTLVQELETFQMKVPVAGASLDAWREGRNDDLVLAVGVAAWVGERDREWKVRIF